MTPFLLVPGLLCSSEIFAPQIHALWPVAPVCVASTLEGSTMEEIANSILRSAPDRFALAGISMGGYLMFEIMRQAPERVDRLALLSTSARPDSEEQTRLRRTMLDQAGKTNFEDWAEKALAVLAHPAHRDDPHLKAVNRRMAQAVGFAGFQRQTEAVIGRPDSRPILREIDKPTLVLVGENDPIISLEMANEMAEGIPSARFVTVPNCGHVSTLEQAEAVSNALFDWLKI